MYFKDIIGQEEAKRRLTAEAREGRMPHARLLHGGEGVGKLALAIALARYVACTNPGPEDACGRCPSCKMMDRLAHPDVHFVFPTVRRRSGKETTSDDLLPQWREMLAGTAYFGLDGWLRQMEAENGQAQILVKESDTIVRKLSLKASQGGYKTVIVWLPEKMNVECANKLLKILEEPAPRTLFLLVSEEPDALPATIRSRTQQMRIAGIDEGLMAQELHQRYGVAEDEARSIAHYAEGNFVKALDAIRLNEEKELFLELFVQLMRLSYARRIREMKEWSENMTALGRERQKLFLAYCGQMLRENFMLNFRESSIVHLHDGERDFSSRFAPFVNETNIFPLMHEFGEAQRHIEQNVNARMVFFDLALKTIVLLVQKKT